MKRILAALLIVLMALSFVACSNTNDPVSNSPPTSNPPDSNAPGGDAAMADTGFEGFDESAGRDTTGEIGFYNPDFDYNQNPRYKFCYLRYTNSPLYEDFANSFIVWASKMNVELDIKDTGGDNDLFISMIETLANQGYDGVLTDPDSTTYSAVVAKCREVGIPFMPVMGLPKDEAGHLLNPHVGFDYYQVGVKMGEWLVDYQKKTWPDAKPEEIGVLGVDFSIVPEISVRIDGALSVINEAYPGIVDRIDRLNDSGRYYHADTIIDTLNSATAYKVSGAILSTHPEIRYWLIVACIDDFGDGSVTAAMDAGLNGRVVAISMGGPGLVAQWDSGEITDFKASFSSIGPIYAEPIFCGLYAMVRGEATAETLWNPEWVNSARGETYAQLLLPTIILEYENYKQYRMWVCEYCGQEIPGYVYPGVSVTRDMFSTRVNPPSSYKN
ncbi:MAG: substrate-binding domain-containing protein [Oscillospiraceae bacterium]|jgi:ABC-type sugar transport system substrate-binding protein|nr:substrate-binding domain-containing protein [Oscillospiraceae bacterium]